MPYSVQVHCRATESTGYRLSTFYDPVRPDGTVIGLKNPIFDLGATNVGVGMSLCVPTQFGLARGTLPFAEPFDIVAQFKIRVCLRPDTDPPSTRPTCDAEQPDMVVYERVNWTRPSP